MKFVTQAEAGKKIVQAPQFRSHVWSYFGEAAAVCEGPQVFLVDMDREGATIKPHFHDVDQFQAIVRGGGRLGRDPAEPIAFHYADAYTPYGVNIR